MTTLAYIIAGIFFLTLIISVIITNRVRKKREQSVSHPQADPLLKMMLLQSYDDEIDRAMSQNFDEDMKRICSTQKYSSMFTHNNYGEIISYSVFANDSLPYWAQLYYNGKTYVLNHNIDGSYYLDDDYGNLPAQVKDLFDPLLPGISGTIKEFNLMENPYHKFWNLETLVRMQHENTLHNSASSLLNLVFFYWHFYTQRNIIDPAFPSYLLTDFVQHPDTDLVAYYPDNALYQFTMGWMMAASPYFFQLNLDGSVGRDMMLKAHQLEPANPLYKWAVSNQLNLTLEETRALAAKVEESQFDGLEPFIRDYFMQILQGDTQVK